MKTSAIMNIFTFSQKASRIGGAWTVPSNARLMWVQEKKRSPTISAPGDSAIATPMMAKNAIVLAVDTNIPRPPSIFEPRARSEGTRASSASGPRLGPGSPVLIYLGT
jgi:hypothetical protein